MPAHKSHRIPLTLYSIRRRACSALIFLFLLPHQMPTWQIRMKSVVILSSRISIAGEDLLGTIFVRMVIDIFAARLHRLENVSNIVEAACAREK